MEVLGKREMERVNTTWTVGSPGREKDGESQGEGMKRETISWSSVIIIRTLQSLLPELCPHRSVRPRPLLLGHLNLSQQRQILQLMDIDGHCDIGMGAVLSRQQWGWTVSKQDVGPLITVLT
ncbi:hypothetical protein Bpfe_012014, partial [Biomphalaria pfeifferi]